MDTFIDRALNLPDYDICLLAIGGLRIYRCQFKSALIILRSTSPLCTGFYGAETESDPEACSLLTHSNPLCSSLTYDIIMQCLWINVL